MTLNMCYSLLDAKVGKYGPLMCFCNDEVAIRSFLSMISSPDKNSMIAMYPGEFNLCYVGTFDNDLGILNPEVAPRIVLNGLQAVTRAAEEVETRRRIRKQLEGISSSASDSE